MQNHNFIHPHKVNFHVERFKDGAPKSVKEQHICQNTDEVIIQTVQDILSRGFVTEIKVRRLDDAEDRLQVTVCKYKLSND